MGAMNELSPEVGTFLCRFSIPIRIDEERVQYFPVIGVFRRIPSDQVDRWVMRPNGSARTDRDLAAEVLLALRRAPGSTGRTASLRFDIDDIIEVDRAAAIIVATFLAELPREEGCGLADASESAGAEQGDAPPVEKPAGRALEDGRELSRGPRYGNCSIAEVTCCFSRRSDFDAPV